MPPELVLAGPNQRDPAIAAATGQPVTIEELLRRRGLVAYQGNMRFSPLDMSSIPNTGGDPANMGVVGEFGDVERQMAAENAIIAAGGTPSPGAGVDAGAGAAGAGMSQIPAPAAAIPTQSNDAQNEELYRAAAESGNGDSWIENLIQLGVVGAAVGAGWLAFKRRNGLGDGAVATPTGALNSPNVNETMRADGPIQQPGPRIAGALPAPQNVPSAALDGEVMPPANPAGRNVEDLQAEWQRTAPDMPFDEFARTRVAEPPPDVIAMGPPPAAANNNEAPRSVAGAITARRDVNRRPQAQQRQARAARGQPNDIATIPMGEDISGVPEDTVRRANELADAIIAQRLRGQRSTRSRIAGSPTAPIYRERMDEPIANQRPALVNEMIRLIQSNNGNQQVPSQYRSGALGGSEGANEPEFGAPTAREQAPETAAQAITQRQQRSSSRRRAPPEVPQARLVEMEQRAQRYLDAAESEELRRYWEQVLTSVRRSIRSVVR